ncbi:hypothetical protein [Pseudonocardia asaccharolytica]|uniref:Uncharacterized protein n=1 Tax=Pseudonocardia asaccharolytica DSM 44247 = NBRC 16224 TaxID=1123024 RepID=A0A511D5T0_9PSEU|nr:hypothetical protein [Pseudonocardia asaccharolytica]GEL20017.1 hypothetical protein PA7_38540 [Pseudonocardia asaccharolytica DSM 44247 = NBRC 16224]
MPEDRHGGRSRGVQQQPRTERQGEVEVEADGADLRVRPIAGDALDEQDGWLVVPATGVPLTDHNVRELRDADQR